MSRTLERLTGAVVAGSLVGLLFAACGPSEADCRAACERPFLVTEEAAALRAEAWKRLPGEYRNGALTAYEAWQASAREAREAYAKECVPGCVAARSEAAIQCRRRAATVGEWKRCAP